MNSPNPELMELYGTDEYYLEKIGFLGPGMLLSGLRVGAGLGSLYAARVQAKHHDQLAAEAAQLNQHFRLIEARKMSAVVESFGGPHDPAASLEPMGKTSSLDPRLEKVAMSLGRSLAHQEMDKEAIPSMSAMWQGAKGMAGKLFSGAKGLMKAETGAAKAAVRPGFKPPGVTDTIGKVQDTVGTVKDMASKRSQQVPPPGTLSGPPIPGPRPANMGGTAEEINAAVAEAAKVQAARNAPRKPLLSTGTKVGLGIAGAGAIGTAGLVGAKGLQEVGDYMRTPTHTGQTWGGYGPSPIHSVNPYGYVQPQY